MCTKRFIWILPAIVFSATSTSLAEVVAKPNRYYPEAKVVFFPSQDAQLKKKTRTTEEKLLLQIFLDETHFGPGVIDGKIGSFTKKAAQAYYRSIDHVSDGLDFAYQQALGYKSIPLVTVQVPHFAEDHIDPTLPYKYREMAERDQSHYRSYLEFMAERYHTSIKGLSSFNRVSKLNSLKAGDTLVVPNVRPFLIENMNFVRFSSDPSINRNHVIVDTKLNRLFVYRPAEKYEQDSVLVKVMKTENAPSNRLIASFPITPGRADQIKYGTWEVKNSVTFPNWRYDPLVLKGTGRSKNSEVVHVPPGPNNPVGILWCGLTARSVGIHGTNAPETIGRTRSSGCIRMANWDVIKIPNFIRPGVKVTIQ